MGGLGALHAPAISIAISAGRIGHFELYDSAPASVRRPHSQISQPKQWPQLSTSQKQGPIWLSWWYLVCCGSVDYAAPLESQIDDPSYDACVGGWQIWRPKYSLSMGPLAGPACLNSSLRTSRRMLDQLGPDRVKDILLRCLIVHDRRKFKGLLHGRLLYIIEHYNV